MSKDDNKVEPPVEQGNTTPPESAVGAALTGEDIAKTVTPPGSTAPMAEQRQLAATAAAIDRKVQTNKPEQIPQVGDQVQLKSGGPVMTVEKYATDGLALCRWSSGDSTTAEYFHYSTLRTVAA